MKLNFAKSVCIPALLLTMSLVDLAMGASLYPGQGALTFDPQSSDSKIIFERVTHVENSDAFTQQINVLADTGFSLTLTDFSFPDELDSLSVKLLSATGSVASLSLQSDRPRLDSNGWKYSNLSAGFNSGVNSNTNRSWGNDFEQVSVGGFLEAGTYYLAMFASFENNWYSGNYRQGLYGVHLATPVPASIVFMVSGLGVLYGLRRKRLNRNLIDC